MGTVLCYKSCHKTRETPVNTGVTENRPLSLKGEKTWKTAVQQLHAELEETVWRNKTSSGFAPNIRFKIIKTKEQSNEKTK